MPRLRGGRRLKLLWVLCNESIAEEVREVMDSVPMTGYTVWQGVLGTSEAGGTHWGDAVWPGRNWAFMIAEEEGRSRRLIELLGALKERPEVRQAGLRVFSQEVEAVL